VCACTAVAFAARYGPRQPAPCASEAAGLLTCLRYFQPQEKAEKMVRDAAAAGANVILLQVGGARFPPACAVCACCLRVMCEQLTGVTPVMHEPWPLLLLLLLPAA
jgi:hypothetical protein